MSRAAMVSASVEFIVRPIEDLYLEGAMRRIKRVQEGDIYPCQMQKNQTFGCLFRHYAKHNGLRKEDLVFYFVSELLPDQVPESVSLMPQDEILVEHRNKRPKPSSAPLEVSGSSQIYFSQMKTLLNSPTHSDVTFRLLGSASGSFPDNELRLIHEDIDTITGGSSSVKSRNIVEQETSIDSEISTNGDNDVFAHKSILCARSAYFAAMFSDSGMKESTSHLVRIEDFDKPTFLRGMEFMYTNSVAGLYSLDWLSVVALFTLANRYCLDDLQKLCEVALGRELDIDNIGRCLQLCSDYNATELRSACVSFVHQNSDILSNHQVFRDEVRESSGLGLLLFDLWQKSPWVGRAEDDVGLVRQSSGRGKRRRVTDGRESHQEPDTLTRVGSLPPVFLSSSGGLNTMTAMQRLSSGTDESVSEVNTSNATVLAAVNPSTFRLSPQAQALRVSVEGASNLSSDAQRVRQLQTPSFGEVMSFPTSHSQTSSAAAEATEGFLSAIVYSTTHESQINRESQLPESNGRTASRASASSSYQRHNSNDRLTPPTNSSHARQPASSNETATQPRDIAEPSSTQGTLGREVTDEISRMTSAEDLFRTLSYPSSRQSGDSILDNEARDSVSDSVTSTDHSLPVHTFGQASAISNLVQQPLPEYFNFEW